MRRGTAFAAGTVVNLGFAGMLGYFNGSPPPPWKDIPGILVYPAGDWQSMPFLLAFMAGVYFVLLLFARKKT